MRLKCMDCLIQMKSRESKWAEFVILYECPECQCAVRSMRREE